MAETMVNALTVDVEDYFQVAAFSQQYPRNCWDSQELRVERNSYRLLELFEHHDVKATFFTLGWVANKCPVLIRDIVGAGHELACHGYWHQKVSEQTPEQFRQDLSAAKNILEDISGCSVDGFRAPSFSIDNNCKWAFDIVRELGFIYSSSTYPINHDHYGSPDWPRFPYEVVESLLEIPVSTLSCCNQNLPISGGGYFRLYPYCISRWALMRYLNTERCPSIFYLHPWEIDPLQPRPDNIPFKSKFRHYLNLAKLEKRLNRLLVDFRWSTIKDVYKQDLTLTIINKGMQGKV
jgi:peptidoglycan-N-acetylglucosamine deacetylase